MAETGPANTRAQATRRDRSPAAQIARNSSDPRTHGLLSPVGLAVYLSSMIAGAVRLGLLVVNWQIRCMAAKQGATKAMAMESSAS